jgi:hypothetical protein
VALALREITVRQFFRRRRLLKSLSKWTPRRLNIHTGAEEIDYEGDWKIAQVGGARRDHACQYVQRGVTSSTINYRIHYLTESGNGEPGFPYPYVGYTDYYCDGSDITYGLVTGNQQYQYVGSC